MRARNVIASSATIAHAAADLVLILVLGSAAVVLDKWDAFRTRDGTRSERVPGKE